MDVLRSPAYRCAVVLGALLFGGVLAGYVGGASTSTGTPISVVGALTVTASPAREMTVSSDDLTLYLTNYTSQSFQVSSTKVQ